MSTPVGKRRRYQRNPRGVQSLVGKAPGTAHPFCSRARRCCRRRHFWGAWHPRCNLRHWSGTPDAHRHRGLLSFLPRPSSSPRRPPLAPTQASLAKSTLGAPPHPTLDTRRIQSVILSSSAPHSTINNIISHAYRSITYRPLTSCHSELSPTIHHRLSARSRT